jgi:hypothetical protein
MAKGFIKTAALALLFAGLTVGASAQVKPGSIFTQVGVGGGFAVETPRNSYDWKGEVTLAGGSVAVDYVLPIGVPLSIGAEVGFYYGIGNTLVIDLPVMGRIGFHPNIAGSPELDTYVVGKCGYDFLAGDGGLSFGLDIGVCYYLFEGIGVFAEAGFDATLYTFTYTSDANIDKVDGLAGRYITIGVRKPF